MSRFAFGLLVGVAVIGGGGPKTFDFTLGTFPSDVTLSRASQATYFNSSGVLTLAAADAPRLDYDPSSLAAKGLLIEPAATNALLYSRDLTQAAWSKRGTAAVTVDSGVTRIDGTTGAIQLVVDFIGNDVFQPPAFGSNGNRFEPSFYLKRVSTSGVITLDNPSGTGGNWSVNLASVGSGWERITRSHPAVTINSEFVIAGGGGGLWFRAGSGGPLTFYVDYCQNELGTFPTSAIPTTTAAVARAADAVSVTGTNFSSWYNQSEGAILFEGDYLGAIGLVNYPVSISSASTGSANVIAAGRVGDDPTLGTIRSAFGYVKTSNVDQAVLSGAVISDGSSFKMALGYKNNDFGLCLNGGTVSTDTSGTVYTSMDIMYLGKWPAGGDTAFPCHIKKISYYNTRQSNANLQTLTT